ncbi:hypothetical protein DYBT9623_00623 [Dyadobacter sp. CECT 9623]|uniref:PorV/PorQ family protein n=1 Tax=Dyadobacter linearis TaxID=2823330 RepID=A0ABM8UKB1_9BACT|nr:hypothetical protein [Dyadobacter sp. CECT 9623]CAG5067896.1 hypothetical protein DYBT9623_00623 [Dyadobacter sp. CECT 9623]
MKIQLIISLKSIIVTILLAVFSFNAFAQRDTLSVVHFGLIYPVSSNGQRAASYTNRFSLHAIAGVSANETGAAIAGAANLIKNNASGGQIAGAVNLIGGEARGMQVAGALNMVGKSSSGIQMAGFGNIVKEKAEGAQVAGFMNLSGSAKGLQIAGFTNIAKDSVQGAQVSGFLNKAGTTNTQVAGFMNIAKKVKGIQLAGLVNIADTSDYPIAIFNFIKSGEKSIALTLDESMTSIASFRSGGRVLYGIAGIGYNLKNNPKALYSVEAGLGAHIGIANHFRLNVEAVSHSLSDFEGGHYFKNSLRVLPAYKLGSRFEVFAGPTVNYVTHEREGEFSFVEKYLWKNNKSTDFQGVFLGFNAGIQLIL